jgi:Tfp pilus assembly protein PilO
MNVKTEIINKLTKLKEILKPYNKPKVVYACGAVIVAIILVFVYWPLAVEISQTTSTLRGLQSELLNQHCTIAALQDARVKSKVIRQYEVPPAIAVLAEKGRSLGLVFRSISPGEVQETDQPSIGRTPINLTIESEYRNIGQFLEYLEELPCGVMEIQNVSISTNEGSLPILNMELMLDLYVEN